MTPTNVTCAGGSATLVAAILAAHGAAASALDAAQGAAARGASGIASWFGATSHRLELSVAGIYGQATTFLAQTSFFYQLDSGFAQLLAPEVYVLFASPVNNTTEASAWQFLPNLLALDPTRSAQLLAASVAHEAIVACGAGVDDLAGVGDAPSAAALAAASPSDAARSARSYLCFLQQFITPTTRDAPTEVLDHD